MSDDINDINGDGLEDNESGDDGVDGVVVDDKLLLGDVEIFLYNVVGFYVDVMGRYLESMVVGGDLKSGLGIGLVVEFDEYSGNLIIFVRDIFGLSSFGFGNELLEFGMVLVNGVDFFVNEIEWIKLMMGLFFVRDVV